MRRPWLPGRHTRLHIQRVLIKRLQGDPEITPQCRFPPSDDVEGFARGRQTIGMLVLPVDRDRPGWEVLAEVHSGLKTAVDLRIPLPEVWFQRGDRIKTANQCLRCIVE